MRRQYAIEILGNHFASIFADRHHVQDRLPGGRWTLHLIRGELYVAMISMRPGIKAEYRQSEAKPGAEWTPVLSEDNPPDDIQSETCAIAQPAPESEV